MLNLRQQCIRTISHIQARLWQANERLLEPRQHGQRVLILIQVAGPKQDRVSLHATDLAGLCTRHKRQPRRGFHDFIQHLAFCDQITLQPALGQFARRKQKTIRGRQPLTPKPTLEPCRRPFSMVLHSQPASWRQRGSHMLQLQRENQSIEMKHNVFARCQAVQTHLASYAMQTKRHLPIAQTWPITILHQVIGGAIHFKYFVIPETLQYGDLSASLA